MTSNLDNQITEAALTEILDAPLGSRAWNSGVVRFHWHPTTGRTVPETPRALFEFVGQQIEGAAGSDGYVEDVATSRPCVLTFEDWLFAVDCTFGVRLSVSEADVRRLLASKMTPKKPTKPEAIKRPGRPPLDPSGARREPWQVMVTPDERDHLRAVLDKLRRS